MCVSVCFVVCVCVCVCVCDSVRVCAHARRGGGSVATHGIKAGISAACKLRGKAGQRPCLLPRSAHLYMLLCSCTWVVVSSRGLLGDCGRLLLGAGGDEPSRERSTRGPRAPPLPLPPLLLLLLVLSLRPSTRTTSRDLSAHRVEGFVKNEAD